MKLRHMKLRWAEQTPQLCDSKEINYATVNTVVGFLDQE